MPNIDLNRRENNIMFNDRRRREAEQQANLMRKMEELEAEKNFYNKARDAENRYKAGVSESEKKFKEYMGEDITDFAKKYRESIEEARQRKDLGMSAVDLAPITEQMKTKDRELRTRLSESGIKSGGMAAKLRLQSDRAFDIAKAYADIQAKEAGRKEYEGKISNVLKYGMTSAENRGALFANIAANLEAARISADASAKAQQSVNSGGGKVICTEMFRQGIIDKDLMFIDNSYGAWLVENYPDIYNGYYAWAKYVVGWMKKSELITKIVSFFAKPWAKDMAWRYVGYGEPNYFGRAMTALLLPVCFIVGKIIKYNKKGCEYGKI